MTQILEQEELTRQFLAFSLDEEVFAIDVAQIREILDRTRLTRIPRMPGYMRGVINLRGAVVPVVDMRTKFDMGRVEETVDTCIIVAEVDLEGEKAVIGAMVDAVQEVFELDSRQLEPPPRMGTRLDTQFIEAMGRWNGGFVIVLDVDRVFSADEILSATSSARVAEGVGVDDADVDDTETTDPPLDDEAAAAVDSESEA